jgi:formylglycine-generating enzyme required for sulfatase activity
MHTNCHFCVPAKWCAFSVITFLPLNPVHLSRFLIPSFGLALACGAFAQSVGTPFCNPMNVNSTGLSTTLTGSWITGAGIGGGMSDLHLECTNGVPSELGYFLVSAGFSDPGGLVISNGLLCVGDATNAYLRYNVIGTSSSSVGLFYASGVLVNFVSASTSGTGFDVPDEVVGTPSVITDGSTWHFQVWHRDTPGAAGSSNFSNGLSVTFPVTPPMLGMVLIPAGSFDMGSDAVLSVAPYFNSANEQPVHNVTISESFWMGEHEVTQAEYQVLMGVNPSYYSGATLPVEKVSWHDARAYCAALTAQAMAAGNLPAGYEYRLPTEAEWEYACRAGTTTEFNVGSDLFCVDAGFWYSDHSNSWCGGTFTIAEGSYSANAFGLYDMHGNVWEWSLDSFASDAPGAVTDSFVTGGSNRVLRGGSCSWYSNACRSAYQKSYTPGALERHFGFRVVLAGVLVP